MILKEEKRDLFSVDKKYYLAHCISSDYALGAGIAVEFNKRYNMQSKLKKIGSNIYPDVIKIDNVFNLVTKHKYYNKPTYTDFERTIIRLKYLLKELDIKYLAIPKLGCGLDKLVWESVKDILYKHFEDLDIEVLVCYK